MYFGLPPSPSHLNVFYTIFFVLFFRLYFFLFLVFVCLFVCLFVLWFTSLSFPHIFFLIFFVLYFKVIFFYFWFVYFGLPSSPSHLFCSHNIFDFLKFIYFLIFYYLDTLLCQPHV